MKVTSSLQKVFTEIIYCHAAMIGVELTEFRLSHDLYQLFLDEVNADIGGTYIEEIGEYKGVKITPVAQQGLFQTVITVQSNINEESDGKRKKG